MISHNLKHNIVHADNVALHYAAQLVEYMVLNANDMSFEWIIKNLRAVAMAWGPGHRGYAETLSVINMMKEMAAHNCLSPARVWLMVKGVIPNGKHLTDELIIFMDNLEINGVIDYQFGFTELEDTTLLLAGKS